MPLPELPITTPEQTSYRRNIQCDSYPQMLRELHQGVLELGVGRCEVLVDDDPKQRTLGFLLKAERGGFTREWAFFVRLTRVKELQGSEAEYLRALFRTAAGRERIAEVMAQGEPPGALASLEAPVV